MNKFNQMLIVSGFALCMAAPAIAGTENPAKMRSIAEAVGLISLEAATAKALEAKPGTVIEVELDARLGLRVRDHRRQRQGVGCRHRRQDRRSTQGQGRLVLNRRFRIDSPTGAARPLFSISDKRPR